MIARRRLRADPEREGEVLGPRFEGHHLTRHVVGQTHEADLDVSLGRPIAPRERDREGPFALALDDAALRLEREHGLRDHDRGGRRGDAHASALDGRLGEGDPAGLADRRVAGRLEPEGRLQSVSLEPLRPLRPHAPRQDGDAHGDGRREPLVPLDPDPDELLAAADERRRRRLCDHVEGHRLDDRDR